MTSISLRPYRISDLDWLVEEHATAYTRDEGFDDTFGPLVRSILEEFSASADPVYERGWIAEISGVRSGSIFCVRQADRVAKLRLFYLTRGARGRGVGRTLLDACIGFAREVGYDELRLWTHESHKAACALYAKTGFECLESRPVCSFGQDLVEQTWRLRL